MKNFSALIALILLVILLSIIAIKNIKGKRTEGVVTDNIEKNIKPERIIESIFDTTINEIEKPDFQLVIGKYHDDIVEAKITIYLNNERVIFHRVNEDGSTGNYELIHKDNKFFIPYFNDKFGEYYIPTKKGLESILS
jgi:hypothetical protein